ncbi:hypothetical protein LR48_Vigan10g069100 [Vigna angularis]|uniref:Uncharacterized protein n=1 Tax=Phaseolus angularis TaxID=3914 RepID=A0A0L9VJ83_PHAAN|nr:hypothetical protein LR48_Vigan10g069100 [Vigna angularis]
MLLFPMVFGTVGNRDPTLGQHQGSHASQIGFSLSCCREGGFVPLLGNEACEIAWLPEDLTRKTQAPWESDVNFPSSSSSSSSPTAAVDAVAEADKEMKAFMAEMNENWNERQRGLKEKEKREENVALYSVENMKKDYRLKKQRLHVELWLKEIEKLEDAKLADSDISVGDDIQRLIDSCSEYTFRSLTPF